jgi:hypothetical protein
MINRSLRLAGGNVTEGTPAANDYEASVGKESAWAMYAGFISQGMFGPVEDVLVEADYTAEENQRIVNISDADVTITLPATITETVAGNEITRPPEDRAFVLVAGPDPFIYIYDADQADWVSIYDLTLDSNAPLSQRYYGDLCTLLAYQLCSDLHLPPPVTLIPYIEPARAALRSKRPRRQGAATAVLRGLARPGRLC